MLSMLVLCECPDRLIYAPKKLGHKNRIYITLYSKTIYRMYKHALMLKPSLYIVYVDKIEDTITSLTSHLFVQQSRSFDISVVNDFTQPL